MARISDVMTSSRDTSPDPLTLPSSPLGSRSPRKTRNAPKFSPRKTRAGATPVKAVTLDTPKTGEASPWRIRVTVEAEPREGSPSKRITRTTTVPLKEETKTRSSSPVKRVADGKDESDVKRPARKRRGTPIRDRRPSRPQPAPEQATEDEDHMPAVALTPARGASGRLARLTTRSSTLRTKRLSVAREELDQALRNAIGHHNEQPSCELPGDKTVSLNEDFSMVSMESLQSTKDASMAIVKQSIPECENSTGVSYAIPPTPEVRYPEIADKAAEARASLASEYDRMSWEATGTAKSNVSQQAVRKQNDQKLSNQQEWQREREAVSRVIQSANAENVIVVDDGAQDTEREEIDREQERAEVEDEFADIWQDEASHSLGDNEHPAVRSHRPSAALPLEATHSPNFQDLVTGESPKPLRSKIPRTWRRFSGMDFHYIDSPAHEPVGEPQQERRHSTDGSGVLTPPSTDDDDLESRAGLEAGLDGGDDVDVESEFQPDAEATRVHGEDIANDHAAFSSPAQSEAASPFSESGGNSSSSDGNDTGGFFSSNMPAIFTKQRPRRRPPRQRTMDLTELLNLDGANSPVKEAASNPKAILESDSRARDVNSSSRAKKRSPLQMRPVLGRIKSSPQDSSKEKVISSPLKRSLLKSSKIYGSPLKRDERKTFHMQYPRAVAGDPNQISLEVVKQSTASAQAESKADGQRQLLKHTTWENGKDHKDELHYDQANTDDYDKETDHDLLNDRSEKLWHDSNQGDYYLEDEDYVHEDEAVDSSPKHEQRLNLDSPRKIKVNFNDSNTSSLLAQRKEYPPLFGIRSDQHQQHIEGAPADSPGTCTVIDKKSSNLPDQTVSTSQPSLLSRLSGTFWSAVVRPTGPTEIKPPQEASASFPASLRTQIRCRYGVASEDFPWTMYHMRILHRMLNSLTSNRGDSIVPRSGPLPAYLSQISNTRQTSITGYQWLFTHAHAHVAWSFFQTLVPQHLIDAMQNGEIEWLGDGMARQCRAYYGKDTRHGSEPVWTKEKHKQTIVRYVNAMQGKIGLDFIVKALGAAVSSNDALAQREGLPFEELQRLGRI